MSRQAHSFLKTNCRIFLGLALSLNLAAGEGLQSNAAAASPRIQFAAETCDFGRVPASKALNYNFVFTNTGGDTLIISDVIPSCSCTLTSGWTAEVAPGKTGVIPVQVHPPIKSGPLDKTVSVLSNDKDRPVIALSLQALLFQPVEAVPQNAFLHISSDSTTNESVTARIVNNLSAPITVSGVEAGDPSFHADVRTLLPGKEFELTVTALPPFFEGERKTVVKIKTSAASAPVVEVPVTAVIHPMLIVQPAQILVPRGPLPGPWSCVVTIRNDSAQLMELAEPVSSVQGVGLELKEAASPRFQSPDIADLSGLATRLQRKTDPVSAFLWAHLGEEIQNRMSGKPLRVPPRNPLRVALAEFLNQLLDSPTLHEEKCFASFSLRPATRFLLANHPTGANLVYLNRLLLDDAYPTELSRNGEPGHHFELTATFPGGFDLNGREGAEITIKTSRAQNPVLRVPVVPGAENHLSAGGGHPNGRAD